MWADTRRRFGAGGPFLFGAAFTAADAMYAPVVTRFLTWQPEIGAATRAYCDAVRAHPLVSAWYEAPPRSRRNGCCPTTKARVSGIALDHVGVVTRDLAALATQYQRLGFTLTPLARQADGRIGNRCVMLHRSYVELLAVVDPNAGSATLDRFLARYAGIHILAFAIDDQTAHSRGCGGPALKRCPLLTSIARSMTWILPALAHGSRSSKCPTSLKAAST